jgi:hypothetical protein
MRVGNVEPDLGNLVNQTKARKMSKRNRTPNCTHMNMDRVYGPYFCVVCGREPDIGFLYECRQDCKAQPLRDLILEGDGGKNPARAAKSVMRLQLEGLGLSESVILTAEQGDYTTVQLEKLKTQKRDLRQIISDTLQAAHINDAVAKLVALAHTPSNHDGASNSTLAVSRAAIPHQVISRPSRKPGMIGTNTLPGAPRLLLQSLSYVSPLLS